MNAPRLLHEQIHHVGMSHVMNLFMEGPRLTIPPKFMNRFIMWEMPHMMNLFMGMQPAGVA